MIQDVIRRRIMRTVQGSSVYDREVEYIKTTGTQFVLNIPYDRLWNIDMQFAFDTNTQQQRMFAVSENGNNAVYVNSNRRYAFSRNGDWKDSNLSSIGIHRSQGAHDAYNTGDQVTHNETHWVSTMDGNVYEPGVYGWEARP